MDKVSHLEVPSGIIGWSERRGRMRFGVEGASVFGDGVTDLMSNTFHALTPVVVAMYVVCSFLQ